METGRYEPVKGDRLGSRRPGVAAMETDRYGPVKEVTRVPAGYVTEDAAMETDRYGPVKASITQRNLQFLIMLQWRPTTTGR